MDIPPKSLCDEDNLQSTIVKWGWNQLSNLQKRDFLTQKIDEVFINFQKSTKFMTKELDLLNIQYVFEYSAVKNRRIFSIYLPNSIAIECHFRLTPTGTFEHILKILKIYPTRGQSYIGLHEQTIDVLDDIIEPIPKELRKTLDTETNGLFLKVIEMVQEFYLHFY